MDIILLDLDDQSLFTLHLHLHLHPQEYGKLLYYTNGMGDANI